MHRFLIQRERTPGMAMVERLTLTRPDDWHLHVRDAALMRRVVPDSARRFARAIIIAESVAADHQY